MKKKLSGVDFCSKRRTFVKIDFMKQLVLEISEQRKKELGQLLSELNRLNIRVVSFDGKPVSDTEEIAQIAELPVGQIPSGTAAKEDSEKKTLIKGRKSPRSAQSSKKSEKTGNYKTNLAKDIQWHFSNHVFPGVEHQTFSREEIYKDADWEKNLH